MIKNFLKNSKTLSEFFKYRSIAIFKNKKTSKKSITKANNTFNEKKNRNRIINIIFKNHLLTMQYNINNSRAKTMITLLKDKEIQKYDIFAI